MRVTVISEVANNSFRLFFNESFFNGLFSRLHFVCTGSGGPYSGVTLQLLAISWTPECGWIVPVVQHLFMRI